MPAGENAASGRVRRKYGKWERLGVIRTFVAEPTTLTREGLVALLSREHDIDVIAIVEHGTRASAASESA